MSSVGKDLSRRDFIKRSAVGAVGLSLPGALAHATRTSADSSSNPPNVLFYFCDQMRADTCTVYGGRNIDTPGLERMAREGTTFTNAISSCPLCTPYRGMLVTGRYPTHSGIVVNRVEINPNQTSIAHLFANAGYKTGFIGKWHLSAGFYNSNLPYPDHPEHVPPGPARLGFEHWEAYNMHQDFVHSWYYRDDPVQLFMDGYQTNAMTDMTIRFMEEQRKSGTPFFLAVAPHPPHTPFKVEQSPPGYLDMIPQHLNWSRNVPLYHFRRANPLQVRCYYSMVKNIDDNITRLLDYLDRSGLSENTIVVFTSDHGEMHGSHDLANKMQPYRESIDVPMIIRQPGTIPAGVRSDALQTPLDHLPTLCALAGLSVPDFADGSDLSPVLLDGASDSRDAVLIANYTSDWNDFTTDNYPSEFRGVRTKQYTYAKYLFGEEELFDNLADPDQLDNLAVDGKRPAVLNHFRRRLKDLLAEAHDDFLSGADYGQWYDSDRNLLRTALGPVG